MFKSYFLKLRHTYDELVAKTYAYFLFNSPWTLIFTYLIFSTLISFGLLSLRLDPRDPESLTYVRNSQALRNFDLLNRTFEFYQYDRNFANKLLYVGYYVEIIVTARMPNASQRTSNLDLLKPEFNLINRTYFEEFNQLFDSILGIEVVDWETETVGLTNKSNEESSSNVTKTNESTPKRRRVYKYDPDLCARRMSKCGTEGGLIREPLFQTKLINHVVYYTDSDPIMSYADTDLMDGVGFTVLFGKYRKDVKNAIISKNSSISRVVLPNDANCITHAGVLRIRFDLLSTTEKEKRLAIKFMKNFVDVMNRNEQENRFKHLNVSYHASKLVNDEIAKYSAHDTKYILLAFVVFATAMTLSMWLGLSSSCLLPWSRRAATDSVLFVGSGCLPLVILLQFVLTTTSTFGLTSLLNFNANPLCFTIVFIFLINGCHQSFVICSNAQAWLVRTNRKRLTRSSGSSQKVPKFYEDELTGENAIAITATPSSPINDDTSMLSLEEFVTRLSQRLIVPNSFGFIALVLSYFVIGFTTCFDSIRLYSLYTALGCLLNQFGQVTFLAPSLYLNLKRATTQGGSCLCTSADYDERDTTDACGVEMSPSLDENVNNIPKTTLRKRTSSTERKSTSSLSSSSPLQRMIRQMRKRIRRFLKSKKSLYFLLSLVGIYGLFNIAVCSLKFRVGIPMVEILPEMSYMRKHMVNHLELFDLAPIVIVAFVKPIDYWNATEFKRIRKFINDAKLIKGIDRRFEWNWLQETHDSMPLNHECDEDPEECFRGKFFNTATNIMLEDDVVYNKSKRQSEALEITASRVYLHYKNFFGDESEIEINERLEWLAYNKYGFKRDQLVFFSIIDVYFEQMAELKTQYLAIAILGIEAIVLIGFLFVFDLKTIFFLTITTVSFTLAVLAAMIISSVKLNFVVLMHFTMMPAFVAEFFVATPYLYLYPGEIKVRKKRSTSLRTDVDKFSPEDELRSDLSPRTSLSNRKPNFRRFKQLEFAFENFIKHSIFFLLAVAMPSFLLTNFASTYAFAMLLKFLLVVIFNLVLHVAVVFPLLLALFGSVWI